jgi:hypothetical protein
MPDAEKWGVPPADWKQLRLRIRARRFARLREIKEIDRWLELIRKI